MLPYGGRSFHGYRLLTEYFAFPEKFFFFDLSGLEVLSHAKFGAALEIVVLIAPFELPERRQALETGVSAQTFRLNCTPVVNLFPQTSEPILLTQKRYEYVVVPDARRRRETEVFSVDDVRLQTHRSADSTPMLPFYSLRHGSLGAQRSLFWVTRRRATPWDPERATEVLISFVDSGGMAAHPDSDAVTCGLTCFNSDRLVGGLSFGDPAGDFTVEGGGPFRRIGAVVRPTAVRQPMMGKDLLSRLVSQLSLNYVSLVDGGADALREIMHLHCAWQTETNLQQISGIQRVESRASHARMVKDFGMGIARGRRVEIEFAEDRFTGAPLFLFASVIERFLAMYASVNSYSQLVARSTRRHGPLREWAPRSGWKTLL
jgi:type VI secretion system protein ImpG